MRGTYGFFPVLVIYGSLSTISSASSWVVDQTTSREYNLVASDGKRFTHCEATCRSLGASLPCIRSRDESDFVRKVVANGEDFWIGLYQKTLCSWKWSSSECTTDFDDWAPGQPDNVNRI